MLNAAQLGETAAIRGHTLPPEMSLPALLTCPQTLGTWPHSDKAIKGSRVPVSSRCCFLLL